MSVPDISHSESDDSDNPGIDGEERNQHDAGNCTDNGDNCGILPVFR
jgi:hypothetical protein